MKYFEDFQVGQSLDCGSKIFHKDEMVAFARQFDPQPFHVDEEKAKRSVFGGLIASGWYTCSVCMRLIVDAIVNQTASMGSPGVDSLRWLKPVRPGDRLRLRATVIEAEASKSKPDRGRLTFTYELSGADGDPVMSMRAVAILGRRPAAGQSA